MVNPCTVSGITLLLCYRWLLPIALLLTTRSPWLTCLANWYLQACAKLTATVLPVGMYHKWAWKQQGVTAWMKPYGHQVPWCTSSTNSQYEKLWSYKYSTTSHQGGNNIIINSMYICIAWCQFSVQTRIIGLNYTNNLPIGNHPRETLWAALGESLGWFPECIPSIYKGYKYAHRKS